VAVLGVLYQGQRKKRGCGVTCPERCTPKPVSQWGKFFAICHFYKNVIDWEKCCIHWRAHLLQTWTHGQTAEACLKLMRCCQVHQAFKNSIEFIQADSEITCGGNRELVMRRSYRQKIFIVEVFWFSGYKWSKIWSKLLVRCWVKGD
jgi:hypothetical protein